ncbi:MAG: hypothetical protein BWX91_00744 [Spirochaetes bacterium ADurb.Bin133]|mgnify:CR=1 FL=1|jgi:hypothetical protein|nr:MAG: hypothetical protein BWX91_00744 [Spirochaetes bacterium ADurb.Bin133]
MRKFIKKIILNISSNIFNFLDKKVLKRYYKTINLINYYTNTGALNSFNFDYNNIMVRALNYVQSMKIGKKIGEYKFAGSCKNPNIYSSAYACMIYSLYNKLNNFSEKEKNEWRNYFDSFQSESDGYFYDNSLLNDNYNKLDWWGKRHLVLHLITCYNNLGFVPKYKFFFLEEYYDLNKFEERLDSMFMQYEKKLSLDIDNFIMNIGALLQYSRDTWKDHKAEESVKWLLEYLENKINKNTGLWTNCDISTLSNLSRTVQFAYHLYPLFLYDNYQINLKEKIIDNVLKTQNIFGGYGVSLNSSACEDIDSIYLLIKLSEKNNYKKESIRNSLQKALPWILANMNEDGGFVFKRDEPLIYGHKEMSSIENESNMFATWFRTLSLAYLIKFLNIKNDYKINRCPGMEF